MHNATAPTSHAYLLLRKQRASGIEHWMSVSVTHDRRNKWARVRSAWRSMWGAEVFGPRAAVVLLFVLIALVGGILLLTRHREPAPLSMSGDKRPRLPNGSLAPPGTSLGIATAITAQSARPEAIHGYFLASDDGLFLCTRLNAYADCRGAPRLAIAHANSRWLFAGPDRLKGLDNGCCSIGSWSPHPIVLRGTVRRHTLFLAPASQ